MSKLVRNVETFLWTLAMNHGQLVVLFSMLAMTALRNKTEREAIFVEVESGFSFTFHETCLATKLQKSFTNPTMLQSTASPWDISFSLKFQRVTAVSVEHVCTQHRQGFFRGLSCPYHVQSADSAIHWISHYPPYNKA